MDLRAAQVAVRDGGDLSQGVERIASGLVRLAHRVGDAGQFKRKTRTHRAITDVLAANAVMLSAYRQLVKAFLIDWAPLTKASWDAVQAKILEIACALCEGATDQTHATEFLAWAEDDPSLSISAPTSPNDAGPNVYRFSEGHRSVDIRLGSIHSVKGQTHLATMVLNTFWYGHSAKKLLPWLLGEKVNGNTAGARDVKRLLQTYVALTRPSHMICLAVPRSVFGDDQALAQYVATLNRRGWRVAEIVDGASEWHA